MSEEERIAYLRDRFRGFFAIPLLKDYKDGIFYIRFVARDENDIGYWVDLSFTKELLSELRETTDKYIESLIRDSRNSLDKT